MEFKRKEYLPLYWDGGKSLRLDNAMCGEPKRLVGKKRKGSGQPHENPEVQSSTITL